MSMPKVWLHVSDGQVGLADDGSYLHTKQPLNAAVFLPVGSAQGRQWCLAIPLGAGTGAKALNVVSLRQLIGAADEEAFALLARASQLEHWWRSHQYCGCCGAKTQRHSDELALECSRCQFLVYPRISPCMIVLVTRGSQILLAKHARSRSNTYSCLAGFVEVGESAEQTVIREVQEEVGLQVQRLSYQTSQNWPFPSQLMLGFWAEYAAGDIQVDGEEIEDAQWFDCDNLPAIIPPKGTISRALIDRFLVMQQKNI